METFFLTGNDLKEFLLYWHGYGYDQAWAEKFRAQYPNFDRTQFVQVQVAQEYYGKTLLKIRKGPSAWHEEGLLIQPLGNTGDVEIGKISPKLFFSFQGQAEFWGDKKSKDFPEENYPYLRITGVEI